MTVTMEVDRGVICDVSVYLPPGLSSSGFSGDANVVTNLKGQRYSERALNSLELSLGGSDNSHSDNKDKYDRLRQVVTYI